MILKNIEKDGTLHYISANEFAVKRICVKGLYDGFKSEHPKTNIGLYNESRYDHLSNYVHSETGFSGPCIRLFNNCEYEELDIICCIQPITKMKEHDTIVTNQMAFLMSDEGKTIERLV